MLLDWLDQRETLGLQALVILVQAVLLVVLEVLALQARWVPQVSKATLVLLERKALLVTLVPKV